MKFIKLTFTRLFYTEVRHWKQKLLQCVSSCVYQLKGMLINLIHTKIDKKVILVLYRDQASRWTKEKTQFDSQQALKRSSLLPRFLTRTGAHPASRPMITEAILPGGKRLIRQVDRPLAFIKYLRFYDFNPQSLFTTLTVKNVFFDFTPDNMIPDCYISQRHV